jgi:lysozyme
MTTLGIDVSHYNGPIDWPSVARANVRFAFAKATEGATLVDPTFAQNWPAIREAGILRGAYHFARPGSDPTVQAACFASTIGPLSWGELPPALDLEVMDGQTPEAVITWTKTFVAKAESLIGCSLIIYTGGLWRNQLSNPDIPELSTRLLWTARYGANPPVVPATWNQWAFWQFTDGKYGDVQQIPGVSGMCDCNWYAGGLGDLQALSNQLGGAPPAPAPVVAAAGNAWPGRVFVWPSSPVVRGPDVEAWQTRIDAHGFSVTSDGIYGPESKTACVAFQRHAGLEPDGAVGLDTWNATFNAEIA